MIFTNNNRITANSRLYKNTSWLSLKHNQSNFPSNSVNFPRQQMYFEFNQPTIVTILWGNGTRNTYSTRVADSKHIFDIDIGAGSDPNAVVKTRKSYGNTSVKSIRFIYDRSALTHLIFFNIFLGVSQDLVFPFSEHSNLKSFSTENIKLSTNNETITDGAILSLNLRNIVVSNVEEFTAIQLFSTSNEYYSKIPIEIFSLPLKVLQLSGDYQSNLASSNVDLISTLSGLEVLTLRVPFTQAQGFPVDVSVIKNSLKELNFPNVRENFNWTSLPENISELVNLERLNLDRDGKTTGVFSFSISNNFFDNMLNIKQINLGHTCRYISNYTWINSLPVDFEHAILTGNNVQVNLDASIMACFNWVKNNSLSDKIFEFQNRVNSTGATNIANIPTGTYQEPIDHDNPASPLEAIWVLVNDYNCTVTYRAV